MNTILIALAYLLSAISGKTADDRILFDGVYMNSDVWLNGHHLGNYPFGYNSFYYDLDPYLKEGENIIAVKAENSKQPNSRWYSGSGILELRIIFPARSFTP